MIFVLKIAFPTFSGILRKAFCDHKNRVGLGLNIGVLDASYTLWRICGEKGCN
jgi:hypothetical protein